jgi:hypothetical protein
MSKGFIGPWIGVSMRKTLLSCIAISLAGSLTIILVSCGRVRFDSFQQDANEPNDSLDDDATDRDASLRSHNVVFITKNTFDGNLGGVAGADAKCQMAAAGKFPGTFVALVATGGYSALDRLDGSRGWQRSDGVLVADDPSEFANQGIRNPIDVDENGDRVLDSTVWTGYREFGQPSPESCSSFTANSSTMPGAIGLAESQAFVLARTITQCSFRLPLLCASIGSNKPLVITPTMQPRVFLSSGPFMINSEGRTLANKMCQSDSAAAGLVNSLGAPAIFRALLPIAGGSAIDVVPRPNDIYARVDGSLVGPLTIMPWRTFVSQRAGGDFDGQRSVWTTGRPNVVAADSTCADWTSGVGSTTNGLSDRSSEQAFNGGVTACSSNKPFVYCVEIP